MKINLKKFTTHILTALVASFGLSAANAQDNVWTGTTSTDWNTAGNWSLTNVPTGQNTVVNNTSGNIATITADLAATPNDIIVTGGGRIDHLAGTAGTGGGSWMYVGKDSTLSTYNLADTSVAGGGITGYGQGSGTVNATGNLQVAAWGGNRNGTMNINTTGALNVTGTLRIGNDVGSVGVMNLESGSVILSHTGWGADVTHIGHGGGVGTLNIGGGSFSASRNFQLGNDRGTGTINITGGSLTVAGTDDVFIGRDKGTGIVNQSGGVVEFNHNTYIANGNYQSDPTSGTYNLSAGVLNVKREFAIGREGASATGTLNMTGGTITKTGDEHMIVGQNNGKGFVVHSGGTINVNQNQLYIGNIGAQGTYTLSGTGALNVANEVVVGRESGTGILNVDGGTMTTTGNGNMYVGRRNGTGTLNQTDGTIVVNKEFGVGTRDDNSTNNIIGTGTYNLSGGSLSAANDIFVGKEQGSSGTMVMTGGTMSGNSSLHIGHNQATGVLTQSGGTVNVQNEVHIGRDNATGTLNLNGGTITTKKLEGGNGSATVNFNGGVLKAKENQDNLIQNLDVANVQSGGAKINSNGFNVATSQVLTGTGGLEKLGAGSLTLSANNTYAGTTTVSEGLLKVNGSVGSVTVSSGGSLGGSGTTGSLLVNGTLTPGNSPGTLNTGSQTWFNGGNYNWQIFDAAGSAGSGYDLLNISGSLDLSNLTAGGFGINMWSLSGINPDVNGNATNFNAANNYSWILAQAAAGITGFEATDFSIFTSANNGAAGFSNTFDGALSIAVAGNNLVLNYQAVPEPSSAALTLLGLVSTLALAKRRR